MITPASNVEDQQNESYFVINYTYFLYRKTPKVLNIKCRKIFSDYFIYIKLKLQPL